MDDSAARRHPVSHRFPGNADPVPTLGLHQREAIPGSSPYPACPPGPAPTAPAQRLWSGPRQGLGPLGRSGPKGRSWEPAGLPSSSCLFRVGTEGAAWPASEGPQRPLASPGPGAARQDLAPVPGWREAPALLTPPPGESQGSLRWAPGAEPSNMLARLLVGPESQPSRETVPQGARHAGAGATGKPRRGPERGGLSVESATKNNPPEASESQR